MIVARMIVSFNHYSSSCSATFFFTSTPHTAGVPISMRYTHFSSSTIFQISSFSAHASTTSVLRFGPFQQCCPFSYFNAMRSPDPRPLPSAGSSSSTVTEVMCAKFPKPVFPPPFLDFCVVRDRKQCSYVYSPLSCSAQWSFSARNIASGP
jgi:hypothetical protein